MTTCPTPDPAALAALLRAERQRRRLTLAAVATACGVGVPYLSKVELGIERPGVALLERLADLWQLDFVALLVLADRVHPTIVAALQRGAAAERLVEARRVWDSVDLAQVHNHYASTAIPVPADPTAALEALHTAQAAYDALKETSDV